MRGRQTRDCCSPRGVATPRLREVARVPGLNRVRARCSDDLAEAGFFLCLKGLLSTRYKGIAMIPTHLLLERTRKIIEPPSSWGRGRLAYTAAGDPAEPYQSEAVCFCLTGAVMRAGYEAGLRGADATAWEAEAFRLLHYELPEHQKNFHPLAAGDLQEWNDGQADHEDVLCLLDKTIKTATRDK